MTSDGGNMKFAYVSTGWFLLTLTPVICAGEKPPIILKYDGWVAAVAFSPDGKTLASAGADNVVRLWAVGTWKPKGVLKGHTDCVCAVAFDPKGKWLASGSFDHTAKAWDLENLEEERTLKGHKGVVSSVLVVDFELFGRGPLVISGGLGGTIHVNDEPLPMLRRRSWVNSLAMSKEASASGSSDGTVALVVATKPSPTILEGGAGEVRCVAFSPDGKLLAAGNRYHTVRVWDVASKKEVKTLTGHMSDVWSIAFSPDGKTLAAVDTDWKKPSKIKLWDTTTWKERGSLACPGEILSIAYSPKGDWLAAGCWDKTVRIFALK